MTTTTNTFIAQQCDQAGEVVEICAEPIQPAEKKLGTIGHAAFAGFGPMTTALCFSRPVQPAVELVCATHPDAPHGFARDASHSAGRYVCDCEGWVPEVAENDVSQPTPTAEPVAWRRPDGGIPANYEYEDGITSFSHDPSAQALYTSQPAPPAATPTTGWPPGMLQDDSRSFSKWLAGQPNALQHVKADTALAAFRMERAELTEILLSLVARDEDGHWTTVFNADTRLPAEFDDLLTTLVSRS